MKMTSASKLLELPDELLDHILRHISPEEVFLHVQLVCKRLRAACSQPLLWKDHCQAEFKYWDPKHRIQQKLKGRVNDVDWKKLYVHRMRTDGDITHILDGILRGQVGRIRKFGWISRFGYDAKDTLLRHCRTGDEVEDVLARRYYAKSVLDHLHRSQALAVWEDVVNGDTVPLDRALGSFDLFVLHDQVGDLSEISQILDDLAAQLRTQYPKFGDLSIRKKAILLASFVLEHNLTGCATEEAYRDLQNSFLGIALQDNDHPSLPLLSVAIYCCIATRLGIDARACGVPHHVHAMVFPSATETLDGREVPAGDDAGEPMYLDPFRSDTEVSKQDLHRMLGSWGIKPHDYGRFLTEVGSRHLMLRTARNILASVKEYKARNAANALSAIQLRNNPFTDMENAFYAALWSNFMFSGKSQQADTYNQRQLIPLILERYERLYPMDSDLVERYICPLFRNQGHQYQEHQDLQAALRVVRAADQTPKQIRKRGGQKPLNVNYFVGQVFRHRRYAYEGVIIGWETECGMNSQWIETNRVDSLSRGRHQSFYHVLVEDNSLRYVAEENMEILEPEAPKSLMDLAGKYFKRWDGESRRFVSNIRDEYPDN